MVYISFLVIIWQLCSSFWNILWFFGSWLSAFILKSKSCGLSLFIFSIFHPPSFSLTSSWTIALAGFLLCGLKSLYWSSVPFWFNLSAARVVSLIIRWISVQYSSPTGLREGKNGDALSLVLLPKPLLGRTRACSCLSAPFERVSWEFLSDFMINYFLLLQWMVWPRIKWQT